MNIYEMKSQNITMYNRKHYIYVGNTGLPPICVYIYRYQPKQIKGMS